MLVEFFYVTYDYLFIVSYYIRFLFVFVFAYRGYSDLDIMFGDLERWITPDELTEFDIVTYGFGDQHRVCEFMLCFVVSCRAVLYLVMLCHVMSCRVVSCRVMPSSVKNIN
jgi:hypothetical protein